MSRPQVLFFLVAAFIFMLPMGVRVFAADESVAEAANSDTSAPAETEAGSAPAPAEFEPAIVPADPEPAAAEVVLPVSEPEPKPLATVPEPSLQSAPKRPATAPASAKFAVTAPAAPNGLNTSHDLDQIIYKISRALDNLERGSNNYGGHATRAVEYLKKALEELQQARR